MLYTQYMTCSTHTMDGLVVDKVIKNGKLKVGEVRIPTTRVQIILSVEMAEALAAIAKIEKRSASEVVRRLLEDHFTGNAAELEMQGITYQSIYKP